MKTLAKVILLMIIGATAYQHATAGTSQHVHSATGDCGHDISHLNTTAGHLQAMAKAAKSGVSYDPGMYTKDSAK